MFLQKNFYGDYLADIFVINKILNEKENYFFENFKETKEGYNLKLSIPGVNPSDIEVFTLNNILTIKLKEKNNLLFKNSLPHNSNIDCITVDYKYGVLEIFIPKIEIVPKYIKIKNI